jgi:hypothetical protein
MNRRRITGLVLVMLLFFGASLACAWVLVRNNNWQLSWHISYPATFQPLDTPPYLAPLHPANPMQEKLPDGSERQLYVFRELTQDSLADASGQLFKIFGGGGGATAQQKGSLAGHDALELSVRASDGFCVQRSILIHGNLFAIVFVGNSEFTSDDLEAFSKICDSMTIRRQS